MTFAGFAALKKAILLGTKMRPGYNRMAETLAVLRHDGVSFSS